MNNPIDTNGFEHFLKFVSLGKTDWYKITEPVGFDSASLTIKQNAQRFSRDILYIADDKKQFFFYNRSAEKNSFSQVQDIDGRVSDFLDYGLNWILETHRRFGFEGKIEYMLKKDGVEFDFGILSMTKPDTDGYTYYGCNIVQNNDISDYKKHADTPINLHSTKNVRNEDITPIDTLKFLRKAVPISQQSAFQTNENFYRYETFYGLDVVFYNPCAEITKSDVESTIPPFDTEYLQNGSDEDIISKINGKTIMIAKRPQHECKISVKNLNWSVQSIGFLMNHRLTLSWGTNPIYDRETVDLISEETNHLSIVNQNYEHTIPYLGIGQRVWLYFVTQCNYTLPAGTPVSTSQIDITNSLKVEINTTSSAINTVIDGARYIDMMKQSSKFIKNTPINAPRFDLGGEFYDQVCWNRAMISQNKSLPFLTTFKDCLGSTEEVCADYEIQKTEIFNGQMPDYYKNVEIGTLLIKPSSEAKEDWNERFMINAFKYGYKTFETNRLSKNTKEDVHTESEWIIPNEMGANRKEISNSFVRSAFSQQAAVDLEINTPTTADDNDDKVYIADIVGLPSNSFNEFGAFLLMRVLDGKLQILNRNSGGVDNDVVINWKVLGFSVGDPFYITSGENSGTYTVFNITASALTLTGSPGYSGDAFIKMKYFYTGINWTTRTDEEMEVSGISNPHSFPNLLRSIRRNMIHWESFLNTACDFVRDKLIRNSYFKSNGLLQTKYKGGITYTENAEIPVSSLQARILSSKVYSFEGLAEFSEMLSILQLYKTERGFIRCYDIDGRVLKGYIQEGDYKFKNKSLTLKIEAKHENEFTTVDFSNGELYVNQVYYDLQGVSKWWKLSNGQFQAFDKKNRPICNKVYYNVVILNDVKYKSADEFLTALISL